MECLYKSMAFAFTTCTSQVAESERERERQTLRFENVCERVTGECVVGVGWFWSWSWSWSWLVMATNEETKKFKPLAEVMVVVFSQLGLTVCVFSPGLVPKNHRTLSYITTDC